MATPNPEDRFRELILPHLDSAFNLACWLTRNRADAQDVVQEAAMRAFKYFSGFHGADGRVWLLRIVRNTCYTWLKQHRAEGAASFDEEVHSGAGGGPDPGEALQQKATRQMLREALEELPAEFREVVVLRELEGYSYKEIAAIVGIPLGTVMSRLTRGRGRLLQCLAPRLNEEL